eukprot:jgi/Chrzof1/2631/Cz11g23060.t1
MQHTQSYTLEQQATDLNTIASFLALRTAPRLTADTVRADIIILAGNSLPCSAKIAAQAIHDGVAPEILITGGIGHSTQHLYNAIKQLPDLASVQTGNKSEADMFHQIITGACKVPDDKVLLETQSTNCGDNATKSLQLLSSLNKHPKSAVLIQDPTMQLRSMACFEKGLAAHGQIQMQLISYAPFVPSIAAQADGQGFEYTTNLVDMQPVWPMDGYISLLMGEIPRLHDTDQGYGPRGKGFIAHVDVPEDILKAYDRLSRVFEARVG